MSGDIQSFKINGEDVSEFHLNAYIANHYSVPVLMITGDEGIIEEAKRLIPNIQGVALIKGFGNSTISIHPNLATKLIEEGGADVVKLLKTHGKEHFLFKQPESFTFEIEFKAHRFANRASYYPGVERVGAKSIKFTGKTIEEAMITYMFIR
jgi:D-amino peptidase